MISNIIFSILLMSYAVNCDGQKTPDMIDSLKNYGELIDYEILPEHKKVQFVSIKEKSDFANVLKQFNGKKLNVDFNELRSDNDSSYMFNLGRISFITVYSLSNGLYAIDQLVNTVANPYYICSSLHDFKLITKYLLVFPAISSLEVWCSIYEHFEIKKFLEKEAQNLVFIKEMSNDQDKIFIYKDGKAIDVRYSDYRSLRGTELGGSILKLFTQINGNKYDSEDIVYSDLVIYESLDKLKFHNVNLKINKDN